MSFSASLPRRTILHVFASLKKRQKRPRSQGVRTTEPAGVPVNGRRCRITPPCLNSERFYSSNTPVWSLPRSEDF